MGNSTDDVVFCVQGDSRRGDLRRTRTSHHVRGSGHAAVGHEPHRLLEVFQGHRRGDGRGTGEAGRAARVR